MPSQDSSRDRIETLKHVMAEIHERSAGKSWQEIASEFDSLKGEASSISDDILRHYAAGTKPVSDSRLLTIARMAKALNYAGEKCFNVISSLTQKNQQWFGLTLEEFSEVEDELKKFGSASRRSKKRALLGLEKAIINVSKCGLSDLELMFAAVVVIRKITPVEAQSGGGGIVDPSCIAETFRDLPEHLVWLETSIVPLCA